MRFRLPGLLLVAGLCGGCGQSAPTTTPTPLQFHPGPNPSAAFSPAVRAAPFVFLSGTIGVEGGKLVPGGIRAETRSIMEQMKATLAGVGLGLDRLVKCTVFLVDTGEWGAMNEVYTTHFAPGRRPARSAVGVASLLFGARVEIECLALAP